MEGSALLGLPVCHRGIELGKVVEVVEDDGRILGLMVYCGDGRRRFVPAHAATLGEEEVTVYSPLALLDEDQTGFYRRV